MEKNEKRRLINLILWQTMTAACVGGSTSKLFSSFSDREKQINLVQQTQKNTNKGKIYFFSFFSESSSPANKMRTSFLQLGKSNIFLSFFPFWNNFFDLKIGWIYFSSLIVFYLVWKFASIVQKTSSCCCQPTGGRKYF